MKTADLIGLGVLGAGLAFGAHLYMRGRENPAGVAVAQPKPPAQIAGAGNFLNDLSSTANSLGGLFQSGSSLFDSLFG